MIKECADNTYPERINVIIKRQKEIWPFLPLEFSKHERTKSVQKIQDLFKKNLGVTKINLDI